MTTTDQQPWRNVTEDEQRKRKLYLDVIEKMFTNIRYETDERSWRYIWYYLERREASRRAGIKPSIFDK